MDTIFDPIAYERVSDGAFFCWNCMWRWMKWYGETPYYRPCSSFVVLAWKDCRECGIRFAHFFREREEDELVTMYDDPLLFVESDRDW